MEVDMREFPDLVRTARTNKQNYLSVRDLADLVSNGEIASVTGAMINAIELGKPCSYKLAYALTIALDLDIEQAMRAAFLARVRYSVGKERESLNDYVSKLPKKQKLDVEKITYLSSRSL